MTARALWQVVADDLRSRISDGTYPVGQPLPVLAAIASTHGCVQNTARRAVRALVAEGLVQAVQGRPAVVVKVPPPTPDRPGSTEDRLEAIERRLDAAGI